MRKLSQHPKASDTLVRFLGGQMRPLVVEAYELGSERRLTVEAFRQLEPAQQLLLCSRIARAVLTLHEELGVVHRSLGVHAFFVTSSLQVKIMCAQVSIVKRAMPSQAMLPPEVLAGDPWTEASDIYTLGLAFVDLLGDLARADVMEIVVRCCDAVAALRPTALQLALLLERLK